MNIRNGLFNAVFIILASIVFAGTTSAATLTVDDSGGADYLSIQDAVNNSVEGDTILVYSGTYLENVNVNKRLILKGTDNGGSLPVIKSLFKGNGAAISLNADEITVEGFVAEAPKPNIGFYGYGIYTKSNSNIIQNNTFNNYGTGIAFRDSRNSSINNNIIKGGSGGIVLVNSNNHTLINNLISNNYGITLVNSNFNKVAHNRLSKYEGIQLDTSTNNVISDNVVLESNTGISIVRSSNNIIRGNNVYDSFRGIEFYESSGNTLYSNTFVKNNNGISLTPGFTNTVYNNIFNNANNFNVEEGSSFNISKTPGENIVGGPYIGGNFWGNPDGTGFSQTCPDGDYDGICDSPYILNSFNISFNTDYLPLTFKPSIDEPFDDFDDNIINPSLWSSYIVGSGPAINEVNQHLEVTFPANSSNDPYYGVFAGGYSSTCLLKGDFDLEADFELLEWPYANGVRIGLGTLGSTERVSLGSNDYIGYPREVYVTDFRNGVHGFFNNSDLSGKLRTVRKGTALTGYYYNSGNWIPIHTFTSASPSDTFFSVSSWSHDYSFINQRVKIALDNLVISEGKLICSDSTPPVTTAILSGTAGLSGWYKSDVQVTLSSEDNSGGAGVAITEYSFDGVSMNAYTGPIPITAEGTTTIYYRTMDKARNMEILKVLKIDIDKTLPEIDGFATTSPNSNFWYNDNVFISFSASDAISGIYALTPDTTISTEGADQSVTGTATDIAGNNNSTTVSGINIDKNQPDIIINSPLSGGVYLLNQMLFANWSAIDTLSGIASTTGSFPDGGVIDTSIVGLKNFSITATDNADNTGSETISYSITYDFSGILSPIKSDGSSQFNSGSMVPVKFRIADVNGVNVTSASAYLNYQLVVNGTPGDEVEPVLNTFTYFAEDNLYLLELDTTGMAAGVYRINVYPDDGTVYHAEFTLKD